MTGQTGNDMKEILSYYKGMDESVHIICHDGFFYNGKLQNIDGNIIFIDDNKLGVTPLALDNIKRVTGFREAGS